MEETMKRIPAGQFKAPVVITKKGRRVARLVARDEPAPEVFGCMAGTAEVAGDLEATVVSVRAWRAPE
jgi:antitoxin (DNA-binding transcriptional repressor) of toxin-antitoxin stability system